MKNLSYLGHEKSVEILDVSLTLEMSIYGLSYYIVTIASVKHCTEVRFASLLSGGFTTRDRS